MVLLDLDISYLTKYCLVGRGSDGRDPCKIQAAKRTLSVVCLGWKRSVSNFSTCYAIVGREDLNEKFGSCRRFSVV